MSIIAPSFSKMASVTTNIPSADDLELAELRLRYDKDKSPRLQKRLWAFVECLIAVVAVETEGLCSRFA